MKLVSKPLWSPAASIPKSSFLSVGFYTCEKQIKQIMWWFEVSLYKGSSLVKVKSHFKVVKLLTKIFSKGYVA